MAEVKAWITVNGRHIPIMEGESKTQALANHFSKLRKEHRGKLEKKYNDGQKKVDELRKNLQDAKNSNNAPMTRFYEKKLQDASEEQFKTTNRIADSYRTINGRAKTVNEKKKEAFDKMNENTRKVNREKEEYERGKGTSLTSSEKEVFDKRVLDGNKEFRKTLATLRDEQNKKYKLKEDTPKQETTEKRKITGREKTKREKINEEYDKAGIEYNKKKGEYLDSARIKRIAKENDIPYLWAYKDAEKEFYSYADNKIFKERNDKQYDIRHGKDNTVDKVSGKKLKDKTGKARKLVVKNAYEKYMKEHPNSKMKLSTFEKTYKK